MHCSRYGIKLLAKIYNCNKTKSHLGLLFLVLGSLSLGQLLLFMLLLHPDVHLPGLEATNPRDKKLFR